MRSCNAEYKQRGQSSIDNLRSRGEEKNGAKPRARADEFKKVDMARAVEGLCPAESCELFISSRFRQRMKQLQRAEIGLDLSCRQAPLQAASSRRLLKPAKKRSAAPTAAATRRGPMVLLVVAKPC